ncbi:MAG: helix-turn-helix domain-containing protein [Oscillibacter sp.]|nr:helix-turn-helix domain-containing protein [Oscillibacter sp.]
MNHSLTYSVEEAARRIGVGKNALYALARAKKIPAIRIGRRYVINAEQFDTWFREQCDNHAEIEL